MILQDSHEGQDTTQRYEREHSQIKAAARRDIKALPHNVMNPRLVAVEGDAPELKGVPFPPDVLGDAPLDEERPPALEACEGRRDGLMEGGRRLTVPVGIAPPAALEEPVMPVMVLFASEVTVGTTPPLAVPVTGGITEGTTEGTTDGVTEGSGLGPVPVGGNVQTVPSGQQPGIPSTELQNSLLNRK